MDLHYFIGAGGAAIIERTVEFIKVQFKLPSYVAPYLVLLFAVLEQYALGYAFHFTWVQVISDVAATLGATFVAHEITSN